MFTTKINWITDKVIHISAEEPEAKFFTRTKRFGYNKTIQKDEINKIQEYNLTDVCNYMIEVVCYEKDLEENKNLAILKFNERLKLNLEKLNQNIQASENFK